MSKCDFNKVALRNGRWYKKSCRQKSSQKYFVKYEFDPLDVISPLDVMYNVPLMYNAPKWLQIQFKYLGTNVARFLKCFKLFWDVIH